MTDKDLERAVLSYPESESDKNIESFAVVFKALGLVGYSSAKTFWASDINAQDFKFLVGDVSYWYAGDSNDAFKNFKLSDFSQGWNADAEYVTPTVKKAIADTLTAYQAINGKGTTKGSKTKYEEAKTALNTVIANNINNFAKVYNRFFGISVSGSESMWNNTTWDKGSVENHYNQYFDEEGEPLNLADEIADAEYFAELVKGYIIEDLISGVVSDVVTLQVANAMNKFKGEYNDAGEIIAKFYKGDYAAMVVAQIVNDLASAWQNSEDILATLKGWVADAEAAIVTVTEANKEYYAALAEFAAKAYGTYVNEDGDTVPYAPYFFEWFGGYTCNPYFGAPEAGEQKAIYDKYLKELVDQYYTALKAQFNAAIRNNSIKNLLSKAEEAAVAALEIANGKEIAATDFAKAVKELTDAIDGEIKTQEDKITEAEWVLAQIAAGVDTKTLAIEKAERALAEAEAALAAAEAQLKVAQAQYDAVMAKYVK